MVRFMKGKNENNSLKEESCCDLEIPCCTPQETTLDESQKTVFKEQIKEKVKEAYNRPPEEFCCCPSETTDYEELQSSYYLGSIPKIADLKLGEFVLDLGSGYGNDVFEAANLVGEKGKVIGVDFAEERIKAARHRACELGLKNVDFKLGEIEDLPIESSSVDVVISNCVINLVPEKDKIMKEIVRVLKPGGRVVIADEIAIKPLSDKVKNDPLKWCACISGAITAEENACLMKEEGLINIDIKPLNSEYDEKTKEFGVISALITARKPK